jgi:maltooligosyltrehalose synthase
MNKPQQQIQLNPIQLLQITSATLAELQKWIEKKQGTPDDSHPKKTIEARNSIFHTRLLTNLRLNEILREIAAKQQTAKLEAAKKHPQGFLSEIVKEMKPLPLDYIDTDSTRQMFQTVQTLQGR